MMQSQPLLLYWKFFFFFLGPQGKDGVGHDGLKPRLNLLLGQVGAYHFWKFTSPSLRMLEHTSYTQQNNEVLELKPGFLRIKVSPWALWCQAHPKLTLNPI